MPIGADEMTPRAESGLAPLAAVLENGEVHLTSGAKAAIPSGISEARRNSAMCVASVEVAFTGLASTRAATVLMVALRANTPIWGRDEPAVLLLPLIDT